MGGTDRHTPGVMVPLLGLGQQPPDLGMDEPYAHGKLPPVALSFQPTRPEYLYLLPVVLLEPPDAVVEYAPRLHEGLAYQGGEAVYQNTGDEGGED